MANKTTGLKIVVDADTDKAQNEIESLDKSFDELGKSAVKSGQSIDKAGDKGTAGLRDIKFEAKKLDRELGKLESSIKDVDRAADKVDGSGLRNLVGVVGGAIGGAALGIAAKETIMLADSYTTLDAKIKLVTDSAQEQQLVNDILFQQSQDNRELVAGNTAAYSKLQLSLRDVGVQSSETLGIVDLVGKSLKVSGASAEEAASFQLQFAQAMGSGVLQGDELRAMLESNSYFGAQLAKALETNIAGLRQMGSDGELTTERLRKAFPKMAEQIEKDFSQMPVTIQEAVNTVVNAFGKVISEGNKSADGTSAVAEAIVNLGRVMEQNKDSIADFFAIMVRGAELGVQSISGLIGIINTLHSGINSLQGGMARQMQSWAMLTDAIGITENAAETWGLVADSAAEKGEEAAGRAMRAFSSMAGEQQDAAGKSTEALKKELLALEAVESASVKAAESLPAASKDIKEFADESGVLETTWRNIDGVWTEVLPNGTALLDDMTGAMQSGAVAAEDLGKASAKAGEVSELSAKDAEKAWKNYLKTVSSAAEQLEQRTGLMGLSDELASLKESTLSASDAYKQTEERVSALGKAAQEAFAEAKKLTEEGKDAEAAKAYEKALEYADEAKDKAKELNTVVEDGDNIIVSQKEAFENAKTAVTEYGELGIDILEAWKEASQDAADTLDDQFNFSGLKDQADAAKDSAAGIGPAISDGVKDGVDSAVSDAKRLEEALDAAAKDRSATITITEVQGAFSGGQIWGTNMSAGARVSGPTGHDSVRAILAGNEWVINNKATGDIGHGHFYLENSRQWDKALLSLASFHGKDKTREILSGYLATDIAMPKAIPQIPYSSGTGLGGQQLPNLGTIIIQNDNTGEKFPVYAKPGDAAKVARVIQQNANDKWHGSGRKGPRPGGI